MRKVTIVSAFGILLALGATVWTQQGSAQAHFEETAIDVGQLTQGQKKVHAFRFSNRGPGTLVIERLRADCYLTATAALASSYVRTGETGIIQVEFDSSFSQPGKFEKFVDLTTNDPRQPVARLRVFGTVTPEFQLSRAAVDFSDVKGRDGSRSEDVIITTEDSSRMRVLSANSSDPRITVHVVQEEGSPHNRAVRIVARVAQNATSGWFMGNIIVTTDSRFSPTVLIPVRGRILASAE